MSDEIKKQFDAFYLFIRTDEKYEEISAQMHDVKIDLENLKNSQDKMEGRVNMGVAVTGQNNSRTISEHAVEIGKLIQKVSDLDGFINHPETGLFKQNKEIKERLDVLYRGIVGIFFTVLCGGAVLYAVNHFKI